jgi:hypothetical protein
MSNEYYRIWNKAKLNIRTAIKKILNGLQWKSTGMTFHGRDEKWKAIQLETFNRKFGKI